MIGTRRRSTSRRKVESKQRTRPSQEADVSTALRITLSHSLPCSPRYHPPLLYLSFFPILLLMTLYHSLWRLTDGTRGGPSAPQVRRWCDREARRPFEAHKSTSTSPYVTIIDTVWLHLEHDHWYLPSLSSPPLDHSHILLRLHYLIIVLYQINQSTNHFFPLFFFFSITWRRQGRASRMANSLSTPSSPYPGRLPAQCGRKQDG